MMKSLNRFCGIIFLTFAFSAEGIAQFPPPPGQSGTTAIHADSSIFIDWASTCIIERGYVDISNESHGHTTYGTELSGIGIADNDAVSLGDYGIATIGFDTPIANGDGWDFAIFENSFSDDFLELAFVEVSSNGIDYVRFNAISHTQTDTQIETFGITDATKINNLAGKYRLYYGTPFDLEELKDLVDINNIISIRIIDVVGSIDSNFSTSDSEGNIINDPWPTPFETSGFDLDAVGVINNQDNTSVNELLMDYSTMIYPNPASNSISLKHLEIIEELRIFSMEGSLVGIYKEPINNSIDISYLENGIYFLTIQFERTTVTQKLIKL